MKLSHKDISHVKSIIRIIGFLCLLDSLLLGVVILIIAELLGILEENV